MRYIVIAALLLFACSPDEDNIQVASSTIVGYDFGSGTPVIGSFRATTVNDLTTVEVLLKDQLRNTIHSVHIYDGSCESPGEIWNLGTADNYCSVDSNGQPWFKSNAGDLGNLLIADDGTGKLTLTTDLWRVGGDSSDDIRGKIIIVHAGATDFLTECDPNHMPDHFHPNTKIGCGLIQ